MTPHQLRELADFVDPNQAWRRPLMEQMSYEDLSKLWAGIALRRYAHHRQTVLDALAEGKSVLITPHSPNCSTVLIIETPPRSGAS